MAYRCYSGGVLGLGAMVPPVLTDEFTPASSVERCYSGGILSFGSMVLPRLKSGWTPTSDTSPSLTSSPDLSISLSGDLSADMALAGTGTISVDGVGTFSLDTLLEGTLHILGPYFGGTPVTMAIDAVVDASSVEDLVSSPDLAVTATGDLTGGLSLEGTATFAIEPDGEASDVVGTIPIVGSVTIAPEAAADLSTDLALAGTAQVQVEVTGAAQADNIIGSGAIAEISLAGDLIERATRLSGSVSVGPELTGETLFFDEGIAEATITLTREVTDTLTLTVVLY